MKVLDRLEEALELQNHDLIDHIGDWNDEIEELLQSSPKTQLEKLIEPAQKELESTTLADLIERGQNVSHRLIQILLGALKGNLAIKWSKELPTIDGHSLEEETQTLQSEWAKTCNGSSDVQHDVKLIPLEKSSLPCLTEILRACKNWLRWYLQIFQATHAGVVAVTTAPDFIHLFKSKTFLQIYLTLLEAICQIGNHEETARHVSQVFFYATFSPVTGSDEQLTQNVDDLCHQGGTTTDSLFARWLRLLVQAKTAPLALSLVRNVHNALVSFPKATTYINETTVQVTDVSALRSPWVAASGDEEYRLVTDGTQQQTYSYKPVLIDILRWAIAVPSGSSAAESTPFPGPPKDLRSELVVEILRTFYALRMGLQLTFPAQGNDQALLAEAVVHIFQLRTIQNGNGMKDERVAECQHATVSLLMDSNSSFAQYLVEQNAVEPLKHILQHEIANVVGPEESPSSSVASLSDSMVSNVAAAAVTPILVVLFNYCSANDEFRKLIRDAVFPPENESHFQKLVEAEKEKHRSAKNMTPLDAPKGTLRARLIRLLTWPQGHIKRFAGELLWVLCSSNSQEFIYRVGMGNALPVLHNKSVVQLPDALRGD